MIPGSMLWFNGISKMAGLVVVVVDGLNLDVG